MRGADARCAHARSVVPEAGAYERRRPEATRLYQVVQDNLETLSGAVDDGAVKLSLPRFVRKELEGHLDCGLLCRGFARLRCDGCAETRAADVERPATQPMMAGLGLPFVVVDLARRDDGVWRVVELADGQVSDRSRATRPLQQIHASEHLHAAAASVYGDGTHETCYRYATLHNTRRDEESGVDKVIRALKHLATKRAPTLVPTLPLRSASTTPLPEPASDVALAALVVHVADGSAALTGVAAETPFRAQGPIARRRPPLLERGVTSAQGQRCRKPQPVVGTSLAAGLTRERRRRTLLKSRLLSDGRSPADSYGTMVGTSARGGDGGGRRAVDDRASGRGG